MGSREQEPTVLGWLVEAQKTLQSESVGCWRQDPHGHLVGYEVGSVRSRAKPFLTEPWLLYSVGTDAAGELVRW